MLDKATTKTFFSLSRLELLPKETRNYVPAVLSSVKLLDSGATLAAFSTSRSRPGARVVYAESLLGN